MKLCRGSLTAFIKARHHCNMHTPSAGAHSRLHRSGHWIRVLRQRVVHVTKTKIIIHTKAHYITEFLCNQNRTDIYRAALQIFSLSYKSIGRASKNRFLQFFTGPHIHNILIYIYILDKLQFYNTHGSLTFFFFTNELKSWKLAILY